MFKVKRDDRYRARLVALGYTQIPGVDYTDNLAPVMTNITLRIVIILWVIFDLEVDQMGVETSFLEVILDNTERIYMKCPSGIVIKKDEYLLLLKTIYGLAKSERVFWKTFTKVLTSKEIGMKQCPVDQCLFHK